MAKDNPKDVLRRSLQGGAAYFVCVTIAHWAGVKLPGLFVYYNIPSYAYQDRGIGIMAFGWAMFLLGASRELSLVPFLLTAGAAGILGFSVINLSTEVAALASPDGVAGFWVVVVGLAAYLGWVIVWWRLSRRS